MNFQTELRLLMFQCFKNASYSDDLYIKTKCSQIEFSRIKISFSPIQLFGSFISKLLDVHSQWYLLYPLALLGVSSTHITLLADGHKVLSLHSTISVEQKYMHDLRYSMPFQIKLPFILSFNISRHIKLRTRPFRVLCT